MNQTEVMMVVSQALADHASVEVGMSANGAVLRHCRCGQWNEMVRVEEDYVEDLHLAEAITAELFKQGVVKQ